MKKLARRDLLKTTASVVAACGMAKLTGCGGSAKPSSPDPAPLPVPAPGTMPTRPFGKTGFAVGIFSLGGQAALERFGQEALSEQIIARALDLGVNYVDTAAAYGGGRSERNIGRVISSRREDVFVATKSAARTYEGAMADLEQSLDNLQTDHVDLWQIHNLTSQAELDAVLSDTGAHLALQQAQTQGMARFVGVTGHFDPAVLVNAITSYEFDAVLMALNAADVHDKSFIQGTLPEAVAREMGIVAMKIPARGRMFRTGGVATMEQALGYVLTHPVSTAIIGCSSVAEVEQNVALAGAFEPFSESEMQHIEALTAPYHQDAAWFKH